MVQQHFRFGLKVVIVVIRLLLKENNKYDPFTTQQVFIMMHEQPIRPHQAIKPKPKLVSVERQHLRLSL
jgi:hypothetical protein